MSYPAVPQPRLSPTSSPPKHNHPEYIQQRFFPDVSQPRAVLVCPVLAMLMQTDRARPTVHLLARRLERNLQWARLSRLEPFNLRSANVRPTRPWRCARLGPQRTFWPDDRNATSNGLDSRASNHSTRAQRWSAQLCHGDAPGSARNAPPPCKGLHLLRRHAPAYSSLATRACHSAQNTMRAVVRDTGGPARKLTPALTTHPLLYRAHERPARRG
jgi:hypothetical protein